MSLKGMSVAVVGGGVGGMAVALALARRGADVTLWERARALGEVGAGLQLGPNAVAALEALEVSDRMRSLVSVPEAIEMREHRAGRLVARLPLGAASTARYGRPYWHIHRADLLGTLADAATEAGVEVRLGHEIMGPDGDTLAGADVVVGADGVRSRLRMLALAGGTARFTGYVAWRGLVPAGQVPAELARPASRVWMAPGRHLVSYPLRGGRLVNFVAVTGQADWTEESWSVPGDPGEMRRAFADFGGHAGALVSGTTSCFRWGLFDHPPLAAWQDGRTVLVGDAAHPMLPFLAQGAAMALEDAVVLAAALDTAPDVATGLAAYERRRLLRATRVQRASARNGGLYHLGVAMRLPVHAGLKAVSSVAPGMLLRRFDWLYGHDVTLTG